MILSSFFFTCNESFKFLISTRCSTHFDSQSAANMISDMVRSEISVQQLPLGLKFSSQNIISSSKTLRLSIQKAFLRSSRFENALNAILMILSSFFSLAKNVLGFSFQHVFRSLRQLEHRKHDIRHGKIRNFGLVSALQVLTLALKTSF